MTAPLVALLSVLASALVIWAIRYLPFLLFRGRKEPGGVAFIERYMPPVAMAVLVVASFAGVRWSGGSHGLPEAAGALVTAGLHLYKRNVFLSIVCGTGSYLLLRFLLAGGV